MGENLHTVFRFDELDRRARATCSPTSSGSAASRRSCRIAALADEHDVALHPHLLPELSGQLALTLAAATLWSKTSRTPGSARSAL